MTDRFLEKFWNCSACGKKHISALRNTRCPSCGNTKVPQDKELFSREEITDSDGLELAKGAPHWTCNYCGTINLDKNSHCDGCGNIRDEEDNTNQVRTISNFHQRVAASEQFESKNFPVSVYTPGSSEFNPRKKINRKILISLVILLSIAFLGLLGFLIFHTNTYSGQVIGFSWKRSINIEEYKVLSDEDWSHPLDAYNIVQETRLHHNEPIYQTKTEQVYVPGSYTTYTDLGNGAVAEHTVDTSHYETRVTQEIVGYTPIYETWYRYNVNRWVYSRSVTTQNDDHRPVWGEYSLQFDGQMVIGAERLGSTSESYTVYFEVILDSEAPKIYSLSANLNDWNEYLLDNTYVLKINHFSIITNNPLYEDQK